MVFFFLSLQIICLKFYLKENGGIIKGGLFKVNEEDFILSSGGNYLQEWDQCKLNR